MRRGSSCGQREFLEHVDRGRCHASSCPSSSPTGNLQPLEQDLGQLLRRVDVETRPPARKSGDSRPESPGRGDRQRPERRGVDPHARLFDLHQHGHQRQLHRPRSVRPALGGQRWACSGVDGGSGRSARSPRTPAPPPRACRPARPPWRPFRNGSSVTGPDADVLDAQRLQCVRRPGRVEQIAGQHRVECGAASFMPCRASTMHVGLEVVARHLKRRVLQ